MLCQFQLFWRNWSLTSADASSTACDADQSLTALTGSTPKTCCTLASPTALLLTSLLLVRRNRQFLGGAADVLLLGLEVLQTVGQRAAILLLYFRLRPLQQIVL